MEIEKLNKLNERLRKTDIKGKDYIEVNQRILGFWELYPEGSILTDILNLENGVVTMRATVKNGDRVLSIGHAQEKEASSFINKTSYIENCETSAIGRALGILGIGATSSIASAEEVLNAMKNQEEKPKPKKEMERAALSIDPRVLERADLLKIKLDKVAAYNKVTVEQLTTEMLEAAVKQQTEAMAKIKAEKEAKAKKEAEAENAEN